MVQQELTKVPQSDLRLLPPWRSVDHDEQQKFIEVINNVRPDNVLSLQKYAIVARTGFRDEFIIRFEDGRFARVLMPDCYFPAHPSDPLEVIYYDDVGRLNDLVAEDATDWGE